MKKVYKILALPLIFSMSATFGAFAQGVFFEGFESGMLPGSWTQEPLNAAVPWSVGNSGVGSAVPISGNYYVKLYSEDYQQSVKLVTPWVNISEFFHPVIEFLMASQTFAEGRRDILRVYIRSTIGGNWSLAGTFAQNTDRWERRKVKIRNITQSDIIQVAFEWIYSNGKGIALDDISIKTEPQCHYPNTTTTNRITHNSANLSWASNTTSEFYLKVSTVPLPYENLENIHADVYDDFVNTNPFYLSGLAPNTTYYWYVKVICPDEDASPWSTETSFFTRCMPIDPPLSESFSAYGTSVSPFPSCWTKRMSAVGDWVSENPFNKLQIIIENESATNTNKVLKMSAVLGANGSASVMVGSPTLAVTDLSAYQLKFRAKASSLKNVLRVCVAIDPDDISTYQEIQRIKSVGNSWEDIVIYLNGAANGGKYVVFYLNGADATEEGTITFWLDDITTENMPYCPKPLYLEAASVTATTANLRWLGLSPSYDIRLYRTPNARPTDPTSPNLIFSGVNMVNGVFEAIGLSPMTRYYGFVRGTCGSDWSAMGTFDTEVVNGTAPFFDGFEGAIGWIFENNASPNKWVVGSATSSSGSYSLYVSDKNGLSNTYDITQASNIYAKRIIELESDKTYDYSYNWRANGEGTGNTAVDYLQVYLQLSETSTPIYLHNSGVRKHSGKSTWQTQTGTFTVPVTGNYYLTAHWENNSTGGNQPPAAIDNIGIAVYTCPKPTNIEISQGVGNATASWTPGGNESRWDVIWGEIGFDEDEADINPVSVPSFSMLGLRDGTRYEVIVRSLCPNDTTIYSREERGYFTTPYITPIPYSTGFENATDNYRWEFRNDADNGWAIGSHTNNGGNNALYISNNGGITNSYTVSPTARYSYVFRTFKLMAGEYNLKFNWKGVGETTSNDACRVFLVPNNSSNLVVGGNDNQMVSNTNTHPADWIPLSDYLYNKPTWQTSNRTFEITSSEEGIYKLVFFWRNNPSAGTQPPIAIDNIEFKKVMCPKLVSINARNITTTDAQVYWSSSEAATYDIKIHPTNFDPTDTTFTPDFGDSNLTNTYFDVSGLSQNTSYYVYIIAHCNNGFSNTYNSAPFIFRTQCDPIPVPYVEPFSSCTINAEPDCWQSFIRKVPNASSVQDGIYYPIVKTEGSGTNLNHYVSILTYYATSAQQGTRHTETYAILPELTNSIADLKISFSAKTNVAGKKIEVGVMDDPSDNTSFTLVEVHTLTTANAWKEYTTFFDGYTGTGKFITFRTDGSASLATYTVDIDNITVVDIVQSCQTPDSARTSNITADSVTISWNSSIPSNDFQVVVSTVDVSRELHLLATLNPSKIIADTIVQNATSVRIGGLEPSTDYYYYIRAICGSEYSYWYNSSKTFRSGCSFFPLPYTQNFNNDGAGTGTMADCWKTLKAGTGTGTSVPYLNSAQKYGTSGASLYMTSNSQSNFTNYGFAISPLFNVPSLANAQVSFMMLVTASNLTGNYVVVGIMENPTNAATFTPIDTVTVTAQNQWQEKIVRFSSYTGTGKYVAFLSDGGRQSYIDDVLVEIIPTCPRPTAINVVAGSVTSSSAIINWTDPLGNTWDIAYGRPDFNPATEGTLISGFTTHPDTVFGLNHSTTYDIYVRTDCGGGDVSTFRGPVTITTSKSANPLPIIEDFENDSTYVSWKVSNNIIGLNFWHIGTDVNNGGSSSAYISNNNGVSNAYSNVESYSYLYRTVEIPQGALDFSFDWRAVGELNEDLLRVFLIPDNVNIDNGNPYNMATNNSTPNTWIDMGGGVKNQQRKWTTYIHPTRTITATEVSAGKNPYKLAFFWKNNEITANQPPAAIDNIYLARQLCARPAIREANAIITPTSANITWSGTADYYNVKIYTADNVDLSQMANIYDNNQTSDTLNLNIFTPNTRYVLYVQGVCGSNTSIWVPYAFRTPVVPIDLPYFTDFEDSAKDVDWEISSSGSTTAMVSANVWAIGNKVINSSRCIYISDDNGVSHHYNNTITSYSYAYKPFNFTAGEYDLSYEWRANGMTGTDLLRVFLVPQSANLATNFPSGITTNNNIPVGWLDLGGANNTSTQLNLSNTFRQNNVSFRLDTDGVYNLAFFWKNSNTGAGNQLPAAIDNISLGKLLCSAPVNLKMTAKTTNSIDVSWTGTERNYNIKVYSVGNDYNLALPGDIYNASVLDTTGHKITGLLPNTTYIIYVEANCGEVNGNSKWIQLIARTVMVPEPLPLVTNFESSVDNLKWNIQGTGANKFFIGNRVSSSGSYSLYVSNDNGNANAYDIGITSNTYAFRMVNVTAGVQYHVAFRWKGMGEGTTDYMRVCLVPVNTTNTNLLETGANNASITATALPTGWINIDGVNSTTNKLNLKNTWQYVSRSYNHSASAGSGSFYIVIIWKNNNSGGEQPPAAIDDFSFNEVMTHNHTDTICVGYPYETKIFKVPPYSTPGVKPTITEYYFDPQTGTSIEKLTLTVRAGGSHTETAETCSNVGYPFFGKILTTPGEYIHYGYASNSCDSTTTLKLKVYPAYDIFKEQVINQDELPVTIGDRTFDEGYPAGYYYIVIDGETNHGCDSIVKIWLEIEPCEICTGIDDIDLINFVIAPNPINAGGRVQITADFTIQESNGLKVDVISVLGGTIKTFYPTTYPIEVSGFDVAGMYIIRVVTGSGKIFFGKVIAK